MAEARREEAANRAAAAWIEQRAPVWRELEAELAGLEGGGRSTREAVLAALGQYPELARDVSIGRRLAPGNPVTRRLQRMYARIHRLLHQAPRSWREDLVRLMTLEAAEAARRLRWQIAAVACGFILAALAGWWLVATYPDLAGLFASEEMIEKVRGGELWTDDLLNIMPSSLLSVSIFTNNVVVALTAVSLGVLFGLGTIYIIGLNGLMLGGVFAFTAQYGMAGRLFEFVCAHGFVELSVIAVAGAVGFSLGEAIARPGQQTRIRSFRRAVLESGPLIAVCVVFLVGAGLIEGYVSPDDRFGLGQRLVIGIGFWLIFLAVLSGLTAPERLRSFARPSAAHSD
jgi:uncharacterized membrane protein SpoIIM required for sporulation